MTPILVVLLVLAVLFVGAIASGVACERSRKRIAERELGFWDANIVAAVNGGALT